VASVSASASQSLTLIGGVLAFDPAPAETSDKPEPIEVPQPLEDPQPVAA
jgi:hypothetical protein